MVSKCDKQKKKKGPLSPYILSFSPPLLQLSILFPLHFPFFPCLSFPFPLFFPLPSPFPHFPFLPKFPQTFQGWETCPLLVTPLGPTIMEKIVETPDAINYRLITAYLLLRVNLDKIMQARWGFDASSARTRRVSALDKHQNWSTCALFCLNSRAQSKYAVVNLIHTRRNQTFLSFIMW